MNEDFYEEILDEWTDTNIDDVEKNCYYGKYLDMIILTIDDDGEIITFLNQYGQFLMIPKNYCDIDSDMVKNSTKRNFYKCKIEPVIAYYMDNDSAYRNILPIMQKYLKLW